MTTNTKRKALHPAKELIARHVQVQPLRIEDMVIAIPGRSKCYFKRLKYKGCPALANTKSEFPSNTVLIDMKRDTFIRECYQLMCANVTVSTHARFYCLVNYLRWVDDAEQEISNGDYFSWSLIDAYMGWCFQQRQLGLMELEVIRVNKNTISWFLRQQGRTREVKLLPTVKGVSGKAKTASSLDLDTELKIIAKALFKAYKSLLSHFNEGTRPERHPLYDEGRVEAEAVKRGLKGRYLTSHRTAFKKVLARTHENNHLVSIAAMITFMFTGMNYSALCKMAIKDVSFKKISGDKFRLLKADSENEIAILESVKGRAKHQEQDNVIGIKKYAKEFIESWVEVSKRMAEGNEQAPLFPYYNQKAKASFYFDSQNAPQQLVNKLLTRLGLPKINSSIFRKTKADTLYRVTESIYLVAITNNNSIEVTSRNYVHGTQKEHENNLNAALSAQFNIAKGQSPVEAVQHAKHQFADVLDDYEYQNLRAGQDRRHEARTPSGVRCNDNRKGASKAVEKALKRAGVEVEVDEMVCTDFLSCFECQEHALVTDVDDIWLMLSFKDTLQQLQQTPSINSMPESKYTKLFNIITAILNDFQQKNPTNYAQACERIKTAPHPLYDNVYSLNDLLEVFA